MRAFLDACVLFPPLVRGLLLSAAAEDLYTPAWSPGVVDEWAWATARDHGPEAGQAVRAEAASMAARWPDALTPAPETAAIPAGRERHPRPRRGPRSPRGPADHLQSARLPRPQAPGPRPCADPPGRRPVGTGGQGARSHVARPRPRADRVPEARAGRARDDPRPQARPPPPPREVAEARGPDAPGRLSLSRPARPTRHAAPRSPPPGPSRADGSSATRSARPAAPSGPASAAGSPAPPA